MGPECMLFHKSLAEKLAIKCGERYAYVMSLFLLCIGSIVTAAEQSVFFAVTQ